MTSAVLDNNLGNTLLDVAQLMLVIAEAAEATEICVLVY